MSLSKKKKNLIKFQSITQYVKRIDTNPKTFLRKNYFSVWFTCLTFINNKYLEV